jgi:hypothetical protein
VRILIPGGSASLPSNDETEEFPVTVEAPETESVTGPSGAPGPDPATGATDPEPMVAPGRAWLPGWSCACSPPRWSCCWCSPAGR